MKSKLFYGWVMVAVTALVLVVTAGARSAPGAFLLDMEKSTGFSKGQLSFATALGLVLFGLGGPLAGGLMGRYGVRAVSVASLLITATALLISSTVQTLWGFNIFFGLMLGLGTGLVASVLGATVATRWFVEKRGLVTGIFGASTSAGQLVFFPLLTSLAVGLGWRQSAVILALVAVVVVPLAWLLIRNTPKDMGTVPFGATAQDTAPPTPEAGVMRRALENSNFWLLAITFFICGFTSNGMIGQHFIPHAVDHGFSQPVAATWLAVMGLFNFIGTMASGWLTDRYDPRRLLMVYYIFRGISLLYLPFAHDNFSIAVFSILFGLDYIATVPPTVALCADTFGRRNVGVIYGWVFAAHQLGAAIAAWLGGVARDSLGNYTLAFTAAGAVAIAGGILAVGIARKPKTALL